MVHYRRHYQHGRKFKRSIDFHTYLRIFENVVASKLCCIFSKHIIDNIILMFFYSGGCASQKENSWIKVCQDQDNKKHFVLSRIF